jgi:hypothetical protein
MRRNSKQEQERERANNARLLRAWKKFHRDEREEAFAGPHGATLAELFRMFKNLELMQPTQLIGYVQSIDWAAIDYTTKLVVVHEADSAITALREKHGLDPINDNLPGDPDTPFRTIKTIVLTASPHNEGAPRGEARPE